MIELPFPSAKLSGHAKGKWWNTSGIVAKHREWALKATIAIRNQLSVPIADDSDIRIAVTFYPPNRRGDRVNYPNRLKPYWDGIADALCVNDRRFLPSFHYAEPVRNARVVFNFPSADEPPNIVELLSGGAVDAFERSLTRIEDPATRKIVIMSKWQRGELSEFETERLIRRMGLVNA